jgi:Mrp family chromosome partitioning ATPase
VGLTECLQGSCTPASAICRIDPFRWYLLPTYQRPDQPSELLQTDAFFRLLRKLASSFDWILVDSPPALPLIDASLLAQAADANLLVARAGVTPGQAIEDAIVLLGRNSLAAVVLNGIEGSNQSYSRYTSYYRAKGR